MRGKAYCIHLPFTLVLTPETRCLQLEGVTISSLYVPAGVKAGRECNTLVGLQYSVCVFSLCSVNLCSGSYFASTRIQCPRSLYS